MNENQLNSAFEFRDGALPLPQVREISRQILSALNYVHSKGVIHTDVKPDNILITRRPGATPIVTLIDFGSATYVAVSRQAAMGSPGYRAPEALLQIGWSCPADIWAAGVVVAELSNGRPLFPCIALREQYLYLIQSALEQPIPSTMIRAAGSCPDPQDPARPPPVDSSGMIFLSPSTTASQYKISPKPLRSVIRHHEMLPLVRQMMSHDPAVRITAADALLTLSCSQETSGSVPQQSDSLPSTVDGIDSDRKLSISAVIEDASTILESRTLCADQKNQSAQCCKIVDDFVAGLTGKETVPSSSVGVLQSRDSEIMDISKNYSSTNGESSDSFSDSILNAHQVFELASCLPLGTPLPASVGNPATEPGSAETDPVSDTISGESSQSTSRLSSSTDVESCAVSFSAEITASSKKLDGQLALSAVNAEVMTLSSVPADLLTPEMQPIDKSSKSYSGEDSVKSFTRKDDLPAESIQPLGPQSVSPVSLTKASQLIGRNCPAAERADSPLSETGLSRRGIVLWQARNSRQSNEPPGPDSPSQAYPDRGHEIVGMTHSPSSTAPTNFYGSNNFNSRSLSRNGSAEPWTIVPRHDSGAGYISGCGGYSAGPIWSKPAEAVSLATPMWAQISTGPTIYGGWMI